MIIIDTNNNRQGKINKKKCYNIYVHYTRFETLVGNAKRMDTHALSHARTRYASGISNKYVIITILHNQYGHRPVYILQTHTHTHARLGSRHNSHAHTLAGARHETTHKSCVLIKINPTSSFSVPELISFR